MTAQLGQTASLTDTGRKRRHNEDAFVVEPPLFAVADGMGGAQAGELASSLAAAALKDVQEPGGGGEERVDELIQQANRRVYERQSQDAAASGMGTTMTVALVEDGRVAIGHVGDSRAYLIRGRSLEQLTEDHSLVAELVRSGKLSPEEAEGHPQRSVITRALGTDPDVDVDTFSVETRPGDLFLICSDGLTSMVDDDMIMTEVARNRGRSQERREGARARREQRRRRGQHHGRLLRDRRRPETPSARSRCPRVKTGRTLPRKRTRSTSSTGCRRFRPRTAADAERAPRGPGRRLLVATLFLALLVGRLRLRRLGTVALALRRYRGERPRRRLPGRPLERRRQRAPLPHRLRQPASRRSAEPGRATEALRPQPAQRGFGARCGAPLRGADRSQMSARNRELANLIVVGILTALGLRERLHRPAGGRLDRLALLRRLLLRALSRRPPGRAADRALGRPVPAADGGPADRNRRDRDLPAQPDRRLPPGPLDRGRARRLRRDAPACSTATTGGSRATSTSSA